MGEKVSLRVQMLGEIFLEVRGTVHLESNRSPLKIYHQLDGKAKRTCNFPEVKRYLIEMAL